MYEWISVQWKEGIWISVIVPSWSCVDNAEFPGAQNQCVHSCRYKRQIHDFFFLWMLHASLDLPMSVTDYA